MLQLSYLCVTGAVLNSLSLAASFVSVYFQHVSKRTGSSVKQDKKKHFLLSFLKDFLKYPSWSLYVAIREQSVLEHKLETLDTNVVVFQLLMEY